MFFFWLLNDSIAQRSGCADEIDTLIAQGEENYTTIFTLEGKRYTITQTLKSLAEQFEPYGFIRVHKSYAVNRSMITSISGSMLYIDSQGLPIGKSYRKTFLATLTIV